MTSQVVYLLCADQFIIIWLVCIVFVVIFAFYYLILNIFFFIHIFVLLTLLLLLLMKLFWYFGIVKRIVKLKTEKNTLCFYQIVFLFHFYLNVEIRFEYFQIVNKWRRCFCFSVHCGRVHTPPFYCVFSLDINFIDFKVILEVSSYPQDVAIWYTVLVD